MTQFSSMDVAQTAAQIALPIEDLQDGGEGSLQSLALSVAGMKCAGCVTAVEKRLRQNPQVRSASVNLVTQMALVEYRVGAEAGSKGDSEADSEADRDRLAADLCGRLTGLGFPTERRDRAQSLPLEAPEPPVWRSVAIAALLLGLSSLGHLSVVLPIEIPFLDQIWLHWALATGTLLGPGRRIWVNGAQGLRHGMPNMNSLIGLGALSAYGASCVALLWPGLGWDCFFDEPVMMLGFILLGRTLEQQARSRAARSLRRLMSLQPDLARLVVVDPSTENEPDPEALALLNGKTVAVAADRLQVGEWVRVLPGEQYPADGQIAVGQTTIDESLVTGESQPIAKGPGAGVIAGSLNLTGAVVAQVTRTGDQTTLARILALVEAAQSRKAPLQRLADRVSGYFTYGVLTIAALTFLVWYGWGTAHWPQVLQAQAHWIADVHGAHSAHAIHGGQAMQGMGHVMGSMDRSMDPRAQALALSLKLTIAVVVVACPCALGLATPTAILVGSTLAAQQGILIRGGDVLEQVQRLDRIVFDKTGTLTEGRPWLTRVQVLADLPETELSETELIRLAASVEAGTCHPLARALQREAQSRGLALSPAEDFETMPGFGVAATIAGQRILLSNGQMSNGQTCSEPAGLAQSGEESGETQVYLQRDGQLLGILSFGDRLRADAIETLAQLQAQGIGIQILSGDRPAAVEAIALALGLPPDSAQGGLTPAAKAEAIAALQSQGLRVGMVGDGVNDAPALAQADLSIAIGSGTDVAIETADLVLLQDRLADLPQALRLSRATVAKIRQNLVWALLYNIISIPLAAGILLPSRGFALSPALAGALMALSSVSVVTNSLLLRLNMKRPPTPHASPNRKLLD
jgi:P-type Cu2+ transporter